MTLSAKYDLQRNFLKLFIGPMFFEENSENAFYSQNWLNHEKLMVHVSSMSSESTPQVLSNDGHVNMFSVLATIYSRGAFLTPCT
jgi:hypothetical protein